MHIALYREFRPVTFDELIGQDHIVRILKNQIRTGNTSHAYLFSGTRGTGKTTTARILAKALNCIGEGEKPCGQCMYCRSFADGSFVDVIEMDAASHRGVNDIHEITDSVMYAPAAGHYKVYIIDEVHMLSNEAFNALLKTLEEPPEHVVFILATTEPQKVPATILSRCMKLDFRRVPEKKLVENMRMICEKKGIEAEQGALSLIAVSADGSVRDSLSILEQCICPGEPLRRDDVAAVLGTAGVEPLLRLTDLVLAQDASGALLCLNEILSSGAETRQFMKEWLGHFRNLLIAKYVRNPSNILNMSTENAERVTEQSVRISQQMLDRAVRELTDTISLTKWAKHPRVMLEMAIVKLAAPLDDSIIVTLENSRSPDRQKPDFRKNSPVKEQNKNIPKSSADRRNPLQAVSTERGSKAEFQQSQEPENRSDHESVEAVYTESPSPRENTYQEQRNHEKWNAEHPEPAVQWDRSALESNTFSEHQPVDDMPVFPEYFEPMGYGEMMTPDLVLSDGSEVHDSEIPETFQNPETDDSALPPQYLRQMVPDRQQESDRHQEPSSERHTSIPSAFSAEEWAHVVDLAASSKGLLIRLRGRTHFKNEKDGRLYITCDDTTTAELLRNRGRETVEQILQKTTGRSLTIVAEVREQDQKGQKDLLEEQQARLNDFFGRDVPIK